MNTEQVQEIFVEDIIPNRFQPRLTFDEKALQELSASIKEHGVIQPLVLRRTGNKYEIIAGERRYKASCMAGLKKVPAIVRDMTDNESAEVALIENVQRKNLTSIEEAQSYKNLLDRGYLTQGELAQKIGVSQPTIANKMRLLNLCDEVQNALLNEQISERHARSLLALSDPDAQKMMLNRIIKERLTVKKLDNEIEKYLSGGNDDTDGSTKTKKKKENKEMNNGMNMMGGEGNRNIFGINVENTTDLETSAPNLNTTIEDNIPPISFNPFASNQNTVNEPYSSDTFTTNANSSQQFNNNPNPFGFTPQNDFSNNVATSSEEITSSPLFNEVETKIEDNTEASTPIETFDMFGDIIEPPKEEETSDELPEIQLSFGDEINRIRDVITTIEKDGYQIEKEEYDFEDMYRITMDIRKDKQD